MDTVFLCPSCSPPVPFEHFRFLQEHANRLHGVHLEKYSDGQGNPDQFRAIPLTEEIRLQIANRRKRDASRKKDKYQQHRQDNVKRGMRTKPVTSTTPSINCTESKPLPVSHSCMRQSPQATSTMDTTTPLYHLPGGTSRGPNATAVSPPREQVDQELLSSDDSQDSIVLSHSGNTWFQVTIPTTSQATQSALQSTSTTQPLPSVTQTGANSFSKDYLMSVLTRPSYSLIVNIVFSQPLPFKSTQLLDIVYVYHDKFSPFERLFITSLIAEVNRELFLEVKNMWAGGHIDPTTELIAWVPYHVAALYEQCSGYYLPSDLDRTYGTPRKDSPHQGLLQDYQLSQIRGFARSVVAYGMNDYRPGSTFLLSDFQQDLNVPDLVESGTQILVESAKRLSFYLIDGKDNTSDGSIIYINKTRLCQLLQCGLGSTPII
jgi:hypothetical protein